VDSEIIHKKLAIEEGAVFEGKSRLSEEPMQADVIDLHSMAAEMKSTEKANAANGMYGASEATAN